MLSANHRTLWQATSVVVFMVGLSFASVPLYDLFCRVTGFGGATVQAKAVPPAEHILPRTIKVGFVSQIASDLPWDFSPTQRFVSARVGAPADITYRVTNHSQQPLVGIATYNVQPESMGAYFNKVICFCFDEQVLQPGETKEYPVQFFIDPDITKDATLDDVTEVTLSYTFFLAKDQSKALSLTTPEGAP